MIKLEKTFVSGEGGFSTAPLTYTQIARTETIALYERSRDGVPKDYEVFQIKILPKGTKVFQTITEDDQEKYPGSSQFGFTAWSINNRTLAMKRYEELNLANGIKTSEVIMDKKEFTIPVKEFTVGEFADKNSLSYANAFVFIKGAVNNGKIKFLREERRNVKGKPSKIYAKA